LGGLVNRTTTARRSVAAGSRSTQPCSTRRSMTSVALLAVMPSRLASSPIGSGPSWARAISAHL